MLAVFRLFNGNTSEFIREFFSPQSSWFVTFPLARPIPPPLSVCRFLFSAVPCRTGVGVSVQTTAFVVVSSSCTVDPCYGTSPLSHQLQWNLFPVLAEEFSDHRIQFSEEGNTSRPSAFRVTLFSFWLHLGSNGKPSLLPPPRVR